MSKKKVEKINEGSLIIQQTKKAQTMWKNLFYEHSEKKGELLKLCRIPIHTYYKAT